MDKPFLRLITLDPGKIHVHTQVLVIPLKRSSFLRTSRVRQTQVDKMSCPTFNEKYIDKIFKIKTERDYMRFEVNPIQTQVEQV